MAAIQTYDGNIKRISDGYGLTRSIYGDFQTTRSSLGTLTAWCRAGYIEALPSLPTGVAGYRLSACTMVSKGAYAMLLCKQVLLGTLDISGASGTFTDGSVMPTQTTLGVSSVTQYGALWLEITTTLSATPGNVSVTWTDQGGTSRNVITSLPANGVVSSGGFVYLAGSQGVGDVTAMSRTAGTTPTGIVKAYGLIPIAQVYSFSSGAYINDLTYNFDNYLLSGGDQLALIMSNTASNGVYGSLDFIGEST